MNIRYSFSLYKTSTSKHGAPQHRDRTFYFFWQSEKAVQSNFKEAQKLGVQGTPVIIIANKDYTKVDFITNFMDEQKFIQIVNNH